MYFNRENRRLDKLDPISLGSDHIAVFEEGNIIIKLCSTL